MKKKKLLLILLVVFVLLLSVFLVWFLKFRNTANDSELKGYDTLEPNLELTVKESPSKIETICQRVEFTLEAKNTGARALKYSEVESGKYTFSFVRNDTKTIVAMTKDNSQGIHNLYLEDFGSIKVNETKDLHFYTQETYVGNLDFGYQNGFNMLQIYGNGNTSFIFEFEKENGGSSYLLLSNMAEVSIDLQAFEYSENTWSSKMCNY